jgi:hypothetical protein
MLNLYTFVLEYRGGTYISQVVAETAQKACNAWAKSLDASKIKHLGIKSKNLLIEELQEDYNELVPLSGLQNTWCTSATVRNHLALINIIETVFQKD